MKPVLRKHIATETLTYQDGTDVTFEVYVDVFRLLQVMGRKARANKDRYSKLGHGAILVKVVQITNPMKVNQNT